MHKKKGNETGTQRQSTIKGAIIAIVAVRIFLSVFIFEIISNRTVSGLLEDNLSDR